ncbi:DnaD domain protein [Paraclostridium bifermentans]|uniref:DnaD domain protein n=1 Tax=Paraclostridium bifermentans TaxID=1490 RepID=UPI001FF550A9|nr:DnaD domain protein [Paraclostridium bifermentans]UOW66892.1 DnaD domain protein [Paraclostridium bifermentans]
MAERRMFAKTLIDSDMFLDMPSSTQCLYFHLSMRADDDGFINNPKKIQRVIGSSDDDLKLLIAKNFIIPFDSGVVVIKHWRIHNYIRSDRYKETLYLEEKSQLITGENKEYILGIPNDIPTVVERETQVRLGKDSIELGKDSIYTKDVNNQIDEHINNSKLKQFSKLYEENLGLINGITAEWLIELCETIDYKLFKRAIEIATDRNKCSPGYVKGIIKQWLDSNIKTYDQLKAYELQKKSQKGVKSDVRGREGTFETKGTNGDPESEEARRRELLEQCRRLNED